jgi:hypothetical protein
MLAATPALGAEPAAAHTSDQVRAGRVATVLSADGINNLAAWPYDDPRLRVSSKGAYLYVNVDPNLPGTQSWRFELRRRPITRAVAPWTFMGSFRTYGSHERRRLSMPKGVYHVKVPAQRGLNKVWQKIVHYADTTPPVLRRVSACRPSAYVPPPGEPVVDGNSWYEFTGYSADAESPAGGPLVYEGGTLVARGYRIRQTRSYSTWVKAQISLPPGRHTLRARVMNGSQLYSTWVTITCDVPEPASP